MCVAKNILEENDIEQRGSEVEVNKYLNFIYLLLQVKNSNPIWRREEVTHNFLGSNPRVRDPYERRNVYVSPSTIPGAGEGLFAKRDMEERELVAYLVYGYMHMFTSSFFSSSTLCFYFIYRGSYLLF
jgi:hypothetical protein